MHAIQQILVSLRIPEVRTRVGTTLGLLLLYRFGAHLLIPGVDPDQAARYVEDLRRTAGSFAYMLMMMSGGALSYLGILSLGILPYITASIIMSLMAKTYPSLEALVKEGPSGQRKLNQYARWLTLPIALFQAIVGYTALLDPNYNLLPEPGFFTMMTVVCALTAGATFAMWLGEQISEFGIGNGASVLIMAGILANLPLIGQRWSELIKQSQGALTNAILLTLVYVATIFAIVFVTQSQRRIPIQHAKHFRGRRVMLGGRNFLPLRVNSAGVMPVIFASALLAIPAFLELIPFLKGISSYFSPRHLLYTLFMIATVFSFSYFWTFMMYQPTEIANNLKENGGFVPGIRPGENTSQYIYYILSRITLLGAAFLCVIVLLPDIVAFSLDVSDRSLVRIVGGTGILIVVGVCLDLTQKIESYLLLHQYGGIAGESPIRGRY